MSDLPPELSQPILCDLSGIGHLPRGVTLLDATDEQWETARQTARAELDEERRRRLHILAAHFGLDLSNEDDRLKLVALTAEKSVPGLKVQHTPAGRPRGRYQIDRLALCNAVDELRKSGLNVSAACRQLALEGGFATKAANPAESLRVTYDNEKKRRNR